MSEKQCYYCNQKLIAVREWYVCHHCKTVAFTRDISFEEKSETIIKFLDDVQKKVLTQQDSLFKLEQCSISGKKLTDEEKMTLENMKKFRSAYTDLHFFTEGSWSGKSGSSQRRTKEALYQLLMISDWLKEKFEIEE